MKTDCKDLELRVTLPDGELVDLTPFFLQYPIYVTVKDNKTYVIYFSKDNVFKFEIDKPFPNTESMFIESEEICLENITKDKLIDIISKSKGLYEAKYLIDKIVLLIKIRLDLIHLYRDKLLKAIEENKLNKIEELMGNLMTIVKVNGHELAAINEIAGDKIKDLINVNEKHKELIIEIIKKINKELGLNIDITKDQ